MPGVTRVVDNARKDSLVPDLLHLSAEAFDLEPLEREAAPGPRARTRAFIKVQDGCNNRCTFCVTTLARGAGRSRSIEQVLKDINQEGVQEAVLTGVHLGSWGQDFSSPKHLKDLIKAILAESSVPRLRLSSLEPWDLDEEFFELWQNPRLCPHLHLPLQSGCTATLRRMARKTTPDSFTALVVAARRMIPGVAITTDVITGFPGESEAEFAESQAFVAAMEFAGGHVFTYSARNGTAAARMPNQVPVPVRRERNAVIRGILEASAQRYRAGYIGQTMEVLWEHARAIDGQSWETSGLTVNYIRVKTRSNEFLWNQVKPVRLLSLVEDWVEGEVTASASESL
jgi:threonylcarbamoyladenosine tRNA methylthiotransferase MtaB